MNVILLLTVLSNWFNAFTFLDHEVYGSFTTYMEPSTWTGESVLFEDGSWYSDGLQGCIKGEACEDKGNFPVGRIYCDDWYTRQWDNNTFLFVQRCSREPLVTGHTYILSDRFTVSHSPLWPENDEDLGREEILVRYWYIDTTYQVLLPSVMYR